MAQGLLLPCFGRVLARVILACDGAPSVTAQHRYPTCDCIQNLSTSYPQGIYQQVPAKGVKKALF